jgi:hypothetical protein
MLDLLYGRMVKLGYEKWKRPEVTRFDEPWGNRTRYQFTADAQTPAYYFGGI